jgi:hypothetical protein
MESILASTVKVQIFFIAYANSSLSRQYCLAESSAIVEIHNRGIVLIHRSEMLDVFCLREIAGSA